MDSKPFCSIDQRRGVEVAVVTPDELADPVLTHFLIRFLSLRLWAVETSYQGRRNPANHDGSPPNMQLYCPADERRTTEKTPRAALR
jgi:hypothetical protein